MSILIILTQWVQFWSTDPQALSRNFVFKISDKFFKIDFFSKISLPQLNISNGMKYMILGVAAKLSTGKLGLTDLSISNSGYI